MSFISGVQKRTQSQLVPDLLLLIAEVFMSISLFSVVMRRSAFCALLMGTFIVMEWAGAGASLAADKRVTLSGCLIRGEGDDAGYLLANPPTEPWLNSPGKEVKPSVLGTSGEYATIFYWLDGHGDLEEHIGHKVEVEGDFRDDVKDGEIKTERKEHWTELTVKADGRTMKAQVPNTSVFPASSRGKERESDILVRRVDVERVHMLRATCN
jgi:hypothetical protein